MNDFMKSVLLICSISIITTVHSQKGMGELEGVSRNGSKYELVTLKGTVTEIKKESCKYTTGKSLSGTHLIMNSNDTILNIHLGPTNKVHNFVIDSKGDQIQIVAFRTKKLPKGHFIAKELDYNNSHLELRDKNLKPFWATNRGRKRWQ
ncbi:hypothetical protein [Flagellimonas sp. 2504JD1-5]